MDVVGKVFQVTPQMSLKRYTVLPEVIYFCVHVVLIQMNYRSIVAKYSQIYVPSASCFTLKSSVLLT